MVAEQVVEESGHIGTTSSDWGFSACENNTIKSSHSMGYDSNHSISLKVQKIDGFGRKAFRSVKSVVKFCLNFC